LKKNILGRLANDGMHRRRESRSFLASRNHFRGGEVL
jgi:hypothetical protein